MRTRHNVALYVHYLSCLLYQMDGVFDAFGGEERCIRGFGGATSRKETTWET